MKLFPIKCQYTILTVLRPENATEVDSSTDFSHCGANYCPQSTSNSNSSTSSNSNFSIEDSQRFLLFGIYLLSAVSGAALIGIAVDPLQKYLFLFWIFLLKPFCGCGSFVKLNCYNNYFIFIILYFKTFFDSRNFSHKCPNHFGLFKNNVFLKYFWELQLWHILFGQWYLSRHVRHLTQRHFRTPTSDCDDSPTQKFNQTFIAYNCVIRQFFHVAHFKCPKSMTIFRRQFGVPTLANKKRNLIQVLFILITMLLADI